MENEEKQFINFKNNHNFLGVKILQQKYAIKNYIFLIALLLLIINIILIYKLCIKSYIYSNNIKDYIYNNDIGNYSLYNLFKYPQISILIPNIEKLNLNNSSLLNLIINLKSQTLKEIEIFISIANIKNISDYHILNNFNKKDNRIKIYYVNQERLLNNIFYLIKKSKGKFVTIIDKFEIFNIDEFEKFYKLTKGEINNIFKFISNNGNDIFLIKSKILKDIIDQDIYFESYSNIINYIYKSSETQLNYISITLCPDNYYSVYTYVAMISILNSKHYLTYISFYLIVTDDFEQKNINFLSSLYDQYDLFNITFLKMDKRYDTAYISRYLTKQTYYRFSVGELLSNLNRIIYLDSDILVYNDLSEFYNLNFNGKIILGQTTYYNKSPITGIYKINNGILLLNLRKMRKVQFEKKVLYILNNSFKNDYHDQFLLNQYFYEYIGIFPPKYHIRPWNNYSEIKQFNKLSGQVFDNDYLYFSCKYPTVLHFAYNSKPIYSNISNSEDWWFFARKSKYYNEKTDNLTKIFNYF